MIFRKKRMMLCSATVAFVLAGTGISLAAPPATAIAQHAYDRDDGKTFQAQGVMTLIDRRGKEKTRTYISYSKDYGPRTKTLIRFNAPADIAGTSFLSWDNEGTDDQFIYLPALKRVRRIVTSQKDGQFVNSDITYEDMERREVNLDRHVLLGTTSLKGYKTVYILKSTPKKPADSQYRFRKSWIAKDLDYLPIKGEFYGKHGKLVKTFEATKIEKINGIWTVTAMTFHDLKRRHRTMVKLDKVRYNKPISNAYFTKTALESY